MEAMMNQLNENQPQPKELARIWLARQVAQRCPPPDINQIRRELGWGLTGVARNEQLP
jgi:hypothetical protein